MLAQEIRSNSASLPSLLTVGEMAKILRIGRIKAYEMVKVPGFPSIKIGRAVRIPTKALFNWIDQKVNSGGAI